jgi:glyoxylase-like metal-dependent hydrolase (beta-lactamase superfamily II)
VALRGHVLRLTAPNPGAMTGPGTNSYLLGEVKTGYIVIDPGPDDRNHIERLWRAAGGDIRMIVCTHSHPDHCPGAWPLQALCAHHPPVLGLPSAPTARPNAHFIPERTLTDNERLRLHGNSTHRTDAAGAITHTLRVVHTPGHAANHVCLIIEEDALLLSGDHILNGSTTVIDPPDGNMTRYLESLDRLDAACVEYGIQAILPAHGDVIGNARGAIAWLKAHRLEREARVAQAMRQRPEGSLGDWLALAYDDVPCAMRPIAARSLAAHVERLRELQARR